MIKNSKSKNCRFCLRAEGEQLQNRAPRTELCSGAGQNSKQNKGIALILTLLILTGLLALALGIATLLTREIKLSQEIANSVLAYGAADTGIERFMYGVNQIEEFDLKACCCPGAGGDCTGWTPCYSDNLSNGASYTVCTKQVGPPVQIKSIGTFGGTNRTIQVVY